MVRIWDTETSELLAAHYLGGPDTPRSERVQRWAAARVTALQFSPDGSLVAGGCADGSLHLFRSSDGELALRLDEPRVHIKHVRAVAFSPDGERLAVTDLNARASVWDVGTGDLLGLLDGHLDDARDVVFDPSGRYVLTASRDNTVRAWDTIEYEQAAVLHGHESMIFNLHLTPNGQTIVTESQDGTLRSWDFPAAVRTRFIHPRLVMGLAADPTRARIVSGAARHQARLWDLDSGGLIAELRHDVPGVIKVAYAPDGSLIATGGADDSIYLWDGATGALVEKISGQARDITAIRFSNDGSLLAWGERDHAVNIIELESQRLVHRLEGHASIPLDLAFSADDSVLISSGYEGTVRAWDMQSGSALWSWRDDDETPIFTSVLCPNDELVCLGGARKIVLVRLSDGEEVARGGGSAGAVMQVGWIPDRSRIVSMGEDGVLRFWTPDSLRNIAAIKAHDGIGRSLTVAHDGSFIATGGEDGRVFVWYRDEQARISAARPLAPPPASEPEPTTRTRGARPRAR
jgi:WD40 repeat protein